MARTIVAARGAGVNEGAAAGGPSAAGGGEEKAGKSPRAQSAAAYYGAGGNMQAKHNLAVFAAATGLVGLAACTAQGRAHEGGRLILFVDMSASIRAEQRGRWAETVERISKSLKAGWGVAVYPIHDQTSAAGALFEAEIGERLEDETYDAASRRRAQEIRAARGMLDAFRTAAGGAARRTDLFAAIDRIRPDGKGRHTTAVFFSDMLNSTAELNMEQPGALAAAAIPDRIRRLARSHNWGPDRLAGVDVHCVLNAVESGERGPAVDRLTQERFYRGLFEAMGGRLAGYDTSLPADGFGVRKGGRYVAQAR
jgi:hypothetical protein